MLEAELLYCILSALTDYEKKQKRVKFFSSLSVITMVADSLKTAIRDFYYVQVFCIVGSSTLLER